VGVGLRKLTCPIYPQECDVVYLHVLVNYWDDGRSVYTAAA
jgi:hypothetical protein